MAVFTLQLLELTEPVEDQKGFVYEKAIVEDHIKKSGQQRVPAPQAGMHIVCKPLVLF